MTNELLFMTIFLTPGEWSFSLASGRAPFRQKVWIPVFEEWHSATGFCARQGRCGAFAQMYMRRSHPFAVRTVIVLYHAMKDNRHGYILADHSLLAAIFTNECSNNMQLKRTCAIRHDCMQDRTGRQSEISLMVTETGKALRALVGRSVQQEHSIDRGELRT